MIISASYRTDIPAFYGRWFLGRLEAGFARVVNPYGGRPSVIDLRPQSVTGFVFWTRNAGSFADGFAAVTAQRVPFLVHVTVLGYPRALDRSVIDADRAVDQMRLLRSCYGPRAVVWRYDPVVLTDFTPPAWHRQTFARIARRLAGVVDEVAVSFVEPYRKTGRNMEKAAAYHGFQWWLPDRAEKIELVGALAEIAADCGMSLTLCTQPQLEGVPGTRPARCVDAARLAAVAGRPLVAKLKGNRPGCYCHQSRDIGAYDSCPHGCTYCYAVSGHAAAKRRYANHDSTAQTLMGP